MLAEVDALEHERAEREHRDADLLALDDVAGALRALDQVVDERVDPARAGLPEELDLRPRQIVRREQAPADRIVDVVVDVGDAVDEPHDLALERLAALPSPVCVRIPSRTSAVRFSSSAIRSDCSLWRKPVPNRSRRQAVELRLAGVAERRMPHVVPEPDRLGQVLVQPQRPRDDAGDPGRLERVRDPRSVVVAGRVDEDLRLPLQAPERLRVHDPVAVALERRPDAALVLLAQPPARLVRADGERREA